MWSKIGHKMQTFNDNQNSLYTFEITHILVVIMTE